jgi:hypothetical protein
LAEYGLGNACLAAAPDDAAGLAQLSFPAPRARIRLNP